MTYSAIGVALIVALSIRAAVAYNGTFAEGLEMSRERAGLSEVSGQFRPFQAPWGLKNGHAMTILGTLRPRNFSLLNQPGHTVHTVRREFATEPGTRVVAIAHTLEQDKGPEQKPDQKPDRPLMLIVHGLQGSASSSYMLGTAIKAWQAGFDVLRLNVRGCGGTSHLSPKLYHSGLTIDLDHVIRELIEVDRVRRIFLIGFSMGANQSLKLAGEYGAAPPPELRGVCAISPPIDLESCSRSIREPGNRIYEARFIRRLARAMREKDRLFPGRYDLSLLDGIRHLWDWDDNFQPYNGFRDARDYYARASSIGYLGAISLPTLIIHAKDDPFIPFEPFTDRRLVGNSRIELIAPEHGGHVAFCGIGQADEDRAWAENRAVEFCRRLANDL